MSNNLNQTILEQMNTDDLWEYRQSIINQMANMAVYLTQVDWVLESREVKGFD